MPASLAAALVERLEAALPAPVERRETHAAWVLLSGDRALKLRKPVRFPFLDYSTRARRLAAALEEVRVNAALAPGLYRGVRALVERDGEIAVVALDGHPAALDHVVEMRRFDERDTMAARGAAGRLRGEQVDAVAELVARFHAAAARCDGGAGAFARRVGADVRELAALTGADAARKRFAAAALARRAGELDARAARGLCRDGHGDLRAEHVVLERTPLIVDRIEFDPGLRRVDAGADLAFLAMDLEARDLRWAAERLTAAYARAGGDPGSSPLRALFAWQRALVRAKVARLRGDEAAAAQLLALAERLAWRERLGGVVLVTGPPASGKSTLATALARAAGLPLLSSDATRKALFGRAPSARLPAEAYREEVTSAVYRRLGMEAARAHAAHGGAVLDATCRTRALRRTLLAQLGDAAPVLAVRCETPAALRRERALARLADPQRVSDAGPDVARRLGERFEAPEGEEAGVADVVAVDGAQPPPLQLAALAAQLDAATLDGGAAPRPEAAAPDGGAAAHPDAAAPNPRSTAPRGGR